MDNKLNNQDKFITHLQRQLEEELNLEKYYQKFLAELKQDKKESMMPSTPSPSRHEHPSPSKVKPKGKRIKTEQASIIEESMVSIDLQGSKAEKKQPKNEIVSFDMEYKLLSKQINKMIEGLCSKDVAFKKTPITTPKKAVANRTSTLRQPQTSLFKMQQINPSQISISKTQRDEKQQSQRQQLLSQLGDITLIISNDEVVSKLISNARLEEQKFVDALLVRTELSAKDKMKNYMQRLSEKNEETLFKFKQTAIDKSLAKLQSNKETVKSGYTQRMRQLIEKGMKRQQQ